MFFVRKQSKNVNGKTDNSHTKKKTFTLALSLTMKQIPSPVGGEVVNGRIGCLMVANMKS